MSKIYCLCVKRIQLSLVDDEFIPKICLKQLGFIYYECGTFTKTKAKIQKWK